MLICLIRVIELLGRYCVYTPSVGSLLFLSCVRASWNEALCGFLCSVRAGFVSTAHLFAVSAKELGIFVFALLSKLW